MSDGDEGKAHRLVIKCWRPWRLNELLGDWRRSSRRKRSDREIVRLHATLQAIPPAMRRRRVDLEITLGKGQRKSDPDAFWKSVLDALVKASLLVDDREEWCEPGAVDQSRRAAEPVTTIVLTDLGETEGG